MKNGMKNGGGGSVCVCVCVSCASSLSSKGHLEGESTCLMGFTCIEVIKDVLTEMTIALQIEFIS